jgi:hypothetical protein
MPQGPSNPPVKVTTSPNGTAVAFEPTGAAQSANPLSTVTAVAAKSTVDASAKLAPGTSVHGTIANAANVSIIFSSDGR